MRLIARPLHRFLWIGRNALGRNRTYNLRIKSPLLCQLSYECVRRFRSNVRRSPPRPWVVHAADLQMARQEGLEPPTHSLEGCRSIQLSYWRNGKAAPTLSATERHESGRPDLNRGPPAPKAGAIPGYATPRCDQS